MGRLKTLGPMVPAADWRIAPPPPKEVDPWYSTAEHQAWRERVIANAGGQCQGCGRSSIRLFADHIREIKDGGARTDPANGQALCGRCHSLKTARVRAERLACVAIDTSTP